ncbi:HIT family protein [Ochrobactrum soli]|uniref:HIT family protein n=1 Tax=Ochrobactrum soli TaxID=2448455 RepID=A0A849KWV6_9HYPH|nr:HIT family protein [[Ochrobactrum] soli]NNU62958.1 HIT family protein [[Ochrobactrum] soli]
MEVPQNFHVFETDEWLVSHRIDSALPGYLIICSKTFTDDLSDLSESALIELGPLLAMAQRAVKQELDARRVYIGRYGHTEGIPIHFHVIPIYDWVEELFWNDDRYRLLDNFAGNPGVTATDGAELTLYVWREFCERAVPPPIKGPSVSQVVELMRRLMESRD